MISQILPTEFWAGAKYYQGTRSPNAAERERNGYSTAWIHHKGRNRHHYEYWTDLSPVTRQYEPVEMPRRYFAEMIMDRIAASKVYKGADYTDGAPLGTSRHPARLPDASYHQASAGSYSYHAPGSGRSSYVSLYSSSGSDREGILSNSFYKLYMRKKTQTDTCLRPFCTPKSAGLPCRSPILKASATASPPK